MKEKTNPDLKQGLGPFAYVLSSLQVLLDPPVAEYRLTVDGMEETRTGLACIVANSGLTGIGEIALGEGIRVDDGLLDVIVIQAEGLSELIGATQELVGDVRSGSFHHWCGRSIRIEAQPDQDVTCDGEEFGRTPVDVTVRPGALRIVTPASDQNPRVQG